MIKSLFLSSPLITPRTTGSHIRRIDPSEKGKKRKWKRIEARIFSYILVVPFRGHTSPPLAPFLLPLSRPFPRAIFLILPFALSNLPSFPTQRHVCHHRAFSHSASTTDSSGLTPLLNGSIEGGRASLKLIMKLNATTAFKSCLPLTNKQGYAELSKGSSVDTSESVSGLATSILGERSGKRFALTISGVARKNGRDCSVCCAPRSRRSRCNQSKWLDKSSVKFAPTSWKESLVTNGAIIL